MKPGNNQPIARKKGSKPNGRKSSLDREQRVKKYQNDRAMNKEDELVVLDKQRVEQNAMMSGVPTAATNNLVAGDDGSDDDDVAPIAMKATVRERTNETLVNYTLLFLIEVF